MQPERTADIVKIENEDVEFFVELLDLGLYSFPDRPSFLKSAVDFLFQRREALIEDCNVFRHCHLVDANLSNFSPERGDLAAQCGKLSQHSLFPLMKRSEFSQHSLLKRSRSWELFCGIFA